MSITPTQLANLATHNLIAAVTFRVTPAEVAGLASATLMLTRDKIVDGPALGCFTCELEALSCMNIPCKGEG